MLNNKGQVATTTTWVVVTLIILLVLGIFIVSASALGKANGLLVSGKKIFVEGGFERTDLLLKTKTAIAYLGGSNKDGIEGFAEEKGINFEELLK